MEKIRKPALAILTENTLEGIGLTGIIEKMIAGAEVHLYNNIKEWNEADLDNFFHYFVSTRILLENADFFLSPERLHRTIVLTHGETINHLPKQFHTLNVCLSEFALTKAFLRLAAAGHSHSSSPHHNIIQTTETKTTSSPLTTREIEVLSLIVKGKINKEIAESLGVSTTTVISHRKNLIEKLNIKSVSGLTIYAVTHGWVRLEDI